jgi:hypothetical protein
MKRIDWNAVGCLVGLAVWLAPALLGLTDAACWFVTAHQCTSIPWQADEGRRIGAAAIWTFALPILLICFV